MDATRKLNFMLKAWNTKGKFLWCLTQIQVPLIVGQQQYLLGPTQTPPTGISTFRPLRILDSSFLRSTTGGITNDISLQVYSRKEYEQQSAKGSLGTVTAVYYDPQISGSNPSSAFDPSQAYGILNVWTTQSTIAQTQTVFLDVQRPTQDMINSDDAFDFPVEWYLAIVKNLRAEMADKYEVPEQRLVRLKNEAREALDEIADWGATEEAPMKLQPDQRLGYYRRAQA